uniref:Uncharacterized protein n=1 Tax=Arundo donax TaxID=35708 RepID=A0A0A8ZAE3_ARUDO
MEALNDINMVFCRFSFIVVQDPKTEKWREYVPGFLIDFFSYCKPLIVVSEAHTKGVGEL